MALKKENRYYNASPDKCYRHLDIPVEFRPPSFDTGNRDLNKFNEIIFSIDELDKNFTDWFRSIGLEIALCRFFTNPPYTKYSVHVDRILPEENLEVVLNFPFDDEGSIISWFNLKEGTEPYIMISPNGVKIVTFNKQDCVPICSTKMKKPTLLNVGYIHTLETGPTYRKCYSFFFKKIADNTNLEWDDAMTIFGPYIS